MSDGKLAKQEIILGNNKRITILNTVIDVLNMQEIGRAHV